jgi:hypothetical protein
MDFNDLNEKFMKARTGKVNETVGPVCPECGHTDCDCGCDPKTGEGCKCLVKTEDQGRDQGGKFAAGGGKPASEPKDKDWAKKAIAKKFGKDAPELQKGYKGSHGDPSMPKPRGGDPEMNKIVARMKKD